MNGRGSIISALRSGDAEGDGGSTARALAAVASELAAAKINIKCAYATAAGGGNAQVVRVVANPDKTERALG